MALGAVPGICEAPLLFIIAPQSGYEFLTALNRIEQYRCMMNVKWRVGVRAGCAVLMAGVFSCGSVEKGDEEPTPDGPSSPRDAGVDAAPARIRFDVGYVDAMTLTPNINSVFGFVAVVNTGTKPLALDTAKVVTFLDDSAAVTWVFGKETGSTAMLAPGRAAGMLTLAAQTKVLANDVVTEQLDDQMLTFQMTFSPRPSAGTVIKAQAVISIEGVNATLPFTLTVENAADVVMTSGRRVLSER